MKTAEPFTLRQKGADIDVPLVSNASEKADCIVEPVDAMAFRRALGQFASGVTVISTLDKQGRDYGMTVSSFTSVSLDPPLVLWCLKTTSFSFAIFAQSTHFAINILSVDQEPTSKTFCQPIDRFAAVERIEGLAGLPLVAGCLAWLECAMQDRIECGDHTIFVGKVLRARVSEKDPLIHWRGKYQALETPRMA